jgi:hypothetical protein
MLLHGPSSSIELSLTKNCNTNGVPSVGVGAHLLLPLSHLPARQGSAVINFRKFLVLAGTPTTLPVPKTVRLLMAQESLAASLLPVLLVSVAIAYSNPLATAVSPMFKPVCSLAQLRPLAVGAAVTSNSNFLIPLRYKKI